MSPGCSTPRFSSAPRCWCKRQSEYAGRCPRPNRRASRVWHDRQVGAQLQASAPCKAQLRGSHCSSQTRPATADHGHRGSKAPQGLHFPSQPNLRKGVSATRWRKHGKPAAWISTQQGAVDAGHHQAWFLAAPIGCGQIGQSLRHKGHGHVRIGTASGLGMRAVAAFQRSLALSHRTAATRSRADRCGLAKRLRPHRE
jgi:hypothetical protein